jgi:membrane protease YdiL (CAAX protease family)
VNKLGALGVYLAWVFGGGALVAPWIWWLGKAMDAAWPDGGLGWLVDHPFPRYVHRCLLVLALVGLWPLTRALGCVSWKAIGWGHAADARRRLVWGGGAGMSGILLVVAMEGLLGDRAWQREWDASTLALGLCRAVLSAGVVAILEETLFRGVLYGGLRPALGGSGAVVVTSLFFSASHFLRRPDAPHEVTWITGYEILLDMLGTLVSWDRLLPAFVTLFLLGALLGLSRHREGNVYSAVGLHAGVVFAAKLRVLLTRAREGAPEGGELMSGWPALLLSLLAVVLFYLSSRDTSDARLGQNRLTQ